MIIHDFFFNDLYDGFLQYDTKVLVLRKRSFMLEWTKLVCTPALALYTGMDKTSLAPALGLYL